MVSGVAAAEAMQFSAADGTPAVPGPKVIAWPAASMIEPAVFSAGVPPQLQATAAPEETFSMVTEWASQVLAARHCVELVPTLHPLVVNAAGDCALAAANGQKAGSKARARMMRRALITRRGSYQLLSAVRFQVLVATQT